MLFIRIVHMVLALVMELTFEFIMDVWEEMITGAKIKVLMISIMKI